MLARTMRNLTAMASRAAAALVALAPAPALAAEGGLKLLSFTTLVGEMITFAILVWVMMKYVWPPLMNVIESRQKEIADGLAASERGRQELADAKQQKEEILQNAKDKSATIVSDGEKQRSDIIERAKAEAQGERERIVAQGRGEVAAERAAMQREMESRLADLVVAGAAQILQREVDAATHDGIINSLKENAKG